MLKSSEKNKVAVEEYSFSSFSNYDDQNGETEDYFFQDLGEGFERNKSPEHQTIIKSERRFAKKNSFKISPVILEHRGLIDQEKDEKERQIAEDVERRLDLYKEDAFKQGFKEGLKAGRNEVIEQTRVATEEKLTCLSTMISEILKTKEEMLVEQKKEVSKIVRNLTKWIILRELKDDDEYVERLLEKLLLQLQSKNNILIQVNHKAFEAMPDILETVQKRLGTLSNVRLEIDYDIETPGLIVESENGIVNGTLEEQFKSLDRLFSPTGIEEDDNQKIGLNLISNGETSALDSDSSEELDENKSDTGSDDE